MKCPNCRSEVQNVPVCPYCGAAVYSQSLQGAARRNTRQGGRSREILRRLRMLEIKVLVLLALQCGTFALALLILVILALK